MPWYFPRVCTGVFKLSLETFAEKTLLNATKIKNCWNIFQVFRKQNGDLKSIRILSKLYCCIEFVKYLVSFLLGTLRNVRQGYPMIRILRFFPDFFCYLPHISTELGHGVFFYWIFAKDFVWNLPVVLPRVSSRFFKGPLMYHVDKESLIFEMLLPFHGLAWTIFKNSISSPNVYANYCWFLYYF